MNRVMRGKIENTKWRGVTKCEIIEKKGTVKREHSPFLFGNEQDIVEKIKITMFLVRAQQLRQEAFDWFRQP